MTLSFSDFILQKNNFIEKNTFQLFISHPYIFLPIFLESKAFLLENDWDSLQLKISDQNACHPNLLAQYLGLFLWLFPKSARIDLLRKHENNFKIDSNSLFFLMNDMFRIELSVIKNKQSILSAQYVDDSNQTLIKKTAYFPLPEGDGTYYFNLDCTEAIAENRNSAILNYNTVKTLSDIICKFIEIRRE